MDLTAIANANKLDPKSAAMQQRVEHRDVADQFEQFFARQIVKILRETSVAGEEGGMMGKGIGADTYADWFDENMSEHITNSSRLGIAETLMRDFERYHQIPSLEAAEAAEATEQEALDAVV